MENNFDLKKLSIFSKVCIKKIAGGCGFRLTL